MDYLLKKFLPRIEFDSYEDFKANYTVNVPENFNFGFDVVDAWAEAEPEKKALVWCDEEDNEKIFTFTDIKRLSNKAANFFKSLGVKKGQRGDAHPPPPVGVLGVAPRPCTSWGPSSSPAPCS